MGATFVYDSSVEQLHHNGNNIRVDYTQAGSANSETQIHDGIVICAGIESRKLGAQLGDRVNIYPVKGYSITVNLPDEESQSAAPWVSLLDDDAKVVTSRLGKGRFRIAGTAEFFLLEKSACPSHTPDHIADIIGNQQAIVRPDGDAYRPSVRVLFIRCKKAAENVARWA